MEQINECFKCIELKKSLQVEKKKVSQKNRLITLLRELVRSYEAKDLNLTFTDLSQIYESSSSEVTILKQRLNLYLNENQELLQQKNEISSRNEILEKKYRDVEDEISHLRFVNKQLGDYYREKEADQDQNKDRLKKLARKLMCYEPKNSEVRKILNLQNTPIDIEPKPSKNSNRKKNEENVKDMKKDNNGDDDLITMKSNPSDILDSEEHDLSGSSECENDIDCNDTNNFLNNEEGRNSPSPVPVLDADKVTTISDDLIASQSFCDKSNSEKSCEIISNSEDGIINCEESDRSSICVDRIDHCSFIKNIPKETSSSKVHENVTAEVLPSLFEEDSCTYEDISEQNDNGANYKDSDDFLEFEDSIPNLISPLKSDDSRVLSYLDCNQTMQHDSVIQENPENSDEVDCNQAVKGNGGSDKNEKESSDIKNECSSNNGDQLDKKKKSSHSTFQSKYQTLNDSLPFSDKPINDSHVPLNGNYAPNYQFQSSHCFGCYNTSFDARPPITLKLYNCSNVEISIPPLMQKENLPIITVRDKCDLDKCCVNTSTDVNPTAVHCSLTPDKRNSHYNEGFTNRRIPTVSTCRKPWLNKSNCNVTENIKEPSNPYFQDGFDRSKNPDYYFLDYLSKNKVSESNSTFRKQCFGDSETENDTIKSNRLFPIKASKRFDLEHFCYRFGSLSLKYSFPEEACKVSTSDKMNSTSIYSSLFNISQPPVFHNSLKNSSTSNNKNEWIFGQNFLNGTTKQDLSCKTATKRNNFLSQSTLENSTNKIKCCNIVQKSIWDLKSDGININSINGTINNKVSANESVSNPFHKIHQFKGTKDCFQQATFDVNSKKTFSEKETNFESRQRIPSQSCMKSNLENNKVSTKETNDNPFRSNSVMLQTSQCSVINPCASTRTSKNDNVFSSDNKGSSKSIFDFDQGKDVLADNCLSHPTICNKKTEHNTTSQSLTQEKVIMDLVKPPALTNSHCSREKVTAEVSSKSHIKERLKDNLLRERPVLQKDKSPKKIKPSGLPQIKNISVNHQDLFKKPDSVNIKANADVKSTENKVEYKSFNTKEAKSALNEKSKIDSPKKADHFSKLNNKKSSPDVKRLCSNKVFPSQNGINEEPRLTAGSKPSNKRVVAHKKSVNISHNLVTDEEDTEIDDELQKIFKEMELLNIPLLSPLSKSPELFAEETSVMNETTESIQRNDKTIKSKEESKLNYSMEVEDENINSIEKLVNKEKLSKCDVINSRLKHNETINDPKQSLSSVDESEYNIFSDNHEIESLSDETSILSENQVNGDILDDTTMEISKETADNGVLESAKISNLSKTEEIDIHNLEKEKSTDNLNESKNYAPPNSEKKHTMSEECISTPDNNCPNKDVGTPECDKEVKLPSCSAVDNKPSIGLGFYVNRNDEESTSNVTVPLRPETPKLECSTITNDPNSDVFNVATEDISSSNGCYAENNSQLITEEVPEENEIPHEKEESSGIKRKLPENNEPFEGMCSKKQKMFSDDEYISCESDVFICALRYLSAAAVASLNGKVCSSPKTNSDVNLPTKIAINHIKNLIIEALQSIDGDTYEVLNCMVKKIKQINDASPTSLAKAIIEIIVESNDKSEAKDKPYMPSMTKTVKMCLLIAVSYIGYNRDFVMNFCEVFEQYISSFYDKSLKVAEGSQLVIFYTSFCRSYNLDDKVKYLIYDVLYTRNIKAYPMVYKTIQTWPDILPYSETCFAKDCVLTQTIIFILLSGASSVDDKSGNIYCINNIRSYLFKYFGYKCNFIRRDELTDKIIGNITAKGGSVALVLLCKCEPWEWSLSIVEKKLLPILQSTSSRSVDETIVCEYILTVGRVVRGFPITKAGHIVKNTLELFERMLLESHSTHLSEIIIEAISLLRRHNLMKCTSILMNWKPNNKQITKKTINHISSILRVKNIGYWKNVYSAHSSNIIHDTRTIRKKRKSGFLNPP